MFTISPHIPDMMALVPWDLGTVALKLHDNHRTLQTIVAYQGLLPDSPLVFMVPPFFRTFEKPASEKSVSDMIDDLDRRITELKDTERGLRQSDAPPAEIDAIASRIDSMTRQLRTLVDHSASIT